jgi:4-aminobutyrate aminotransferase
MTRKLTRDLAVVARDEKVISPASRVPYWPLVVDHGHDAVLVDVDGNEYIDFFAGAAVSNTGHAHPKVVGAIQAQAAKFVHFTPAYVYNEPVVDLAEHLVKITPGKFPKKVSFGLSGSDANDGAMKLSRIATKRQRFISFLRSYHGSTYGALSLSAVALNMTRGLGPVVPGVVHVPFPDCYRCPFGLTHATCDLHCLEFIETLFETSTPADEVAALFIELIQGDAGIVVPPDEYLPALKKLCEKHGILFVAEEVQTGFGRTGKWFACDHWDIEPDIILLGKSIASGMPLSAIVAKAEIMDSWKAPAHLFTMHGNPVCSAAALATIDVIKSEKLVQRSATLGKKIMARFNKMAEKYELIGDVRGRGLMIGVDLVKDRVTKERARDEAAKICLRCYEKGVLLPFFSLSVLRVEPPLVISDEQVDKAMDIIEDSIDEVVSGKVPDEAIAKVKGW